MRVEQARIIALAVALAVATGGCHRGREQVSEADMERAQATLAPFKEQLIDALMGALDEGGPVNAIHVCRERAPAIAAGLSKGGVEMGRTSHKLRNPQNAPAPWVEPLLAAYLEEPTSSAPRAVYIDDNTVGYVEPIYVMPFCLSCHGPSVDAGLLQEIRAVYPEDRAIDFKANDLRGLFWVTLPRAS